MKKLKTKFKSVKGFTLIELLVVIAIIGILGAIVYAPFQSARRKARDAQRIVEMKNLTSTIQLYADSNGGLYPTSTVALQASLNEKLPTATNFGATYIPTDYNYTPLADSNSRIIGFHLYTHLETAAEAIAGGAHCRGISNSQSVSSSSNYCIVAPNTTSNGATFGNGAIDDTSAAVDAKFLDSERTADTDKNCATDLTSCILDYHQ